MLLSETKKPVMKILAIIIFFGTVINHMVEVLPENNNTGIVVMGPM